MGVNEDKFFCNCWTCGPHPLISTLKEAASFPDSLPPGILAELRENAKRRPNFGRKTGGKLLLPYDAGELQSPHRRYLKRRKLDPDEMSELWGFKGVGMSHEYQWRIVIPTTVGGEVVTWTTRTIDDEVEPRYKASTPDRELVSCRDVLFGEDYCRHAIAVAEGHLSAVTGGPGCVATGGTGYSDAHVLRIARYPFRIVAFDNTPDGHKRADQLVRELSMFDGETVKVTVSGKDLNSSPISDVKQLRRMLK